MGRYRDPMASFQYPEEMITISAPGHTYYPIGPRHAPPGALLGLPAKRMLVSSCKRIGQPIQVLQPSGIPVRPLLLP